MLSKSGCMLLFYTYATALATRMGPAHVATHQVALSFWWLVTFWLDSGSISGQLLMSQSLQDPHQARSLTKYMTKYALLQGVACSVIVAVVGIYFLPSIFAISDPAVKHLLVQLVPHLALQQIIVSLCLVFEGMAIGGNQFRFMAVGTFLAALLGVRQLSQATSVVGIWANAFTIFFSARLINAIFGVARVHFGLRQKNNQQGMLHTTTILPTMDDEEGTTTTTVAAAIQETTQSSQQV
jgi:Na+-driven multidrug efflux pump